VVPTAVGLAVHPWLGRLPGDIIIRHENFSFYFPLAASLLLSVVLSVLFCLFRGVAPGNGRGPRGSCNAGGCDAGGARYCDILLGLSPANTVN